MKRLRSNKEKVKNAFCSVILLLCFIAVGIAGKYEYEDLENEIRYEKEGIAPQNYGERPVEQVKEVWIAYDTPELDQEADQFEELCQIVMSEGGYTEPDAGIHLMAAGVLNRVDSPLFPNNIHDVIFQPGQFEPVSTGTFYKYVPTERVIQICASEMMHRTNTRVLFWKTRGYHKGTIPIAHIGAHYYSGRW